MNTPSRSETESQLSKSLPANTEIIVINSLPSPAEQQAGGFVLVCRSFIIHMGQKWQVFLQNTITGNLIAIYLLASGSGAPIPSPYQISIMSASTFASISTSVFQNMANGTEFTDSYLVALPPTESPIPTGNQIQWDNLPIGTGIYPVSSGFLRSI